MIERNKWPDEVKRIKDEFDMHAVAGNTGYVAIALADGKPLDHTCYPTWMLAVTAAKWDRDNYMFPEITPDGITYKGAAAILHYARTMHDMGFRIPSPDWEAGPLVSSMPEQQHDRMRMIRQLVSGKPIVPDDVPYSNLPQDIPPAFIRKAN